MEPKNPISEEHERRLVDMMLKQGSTLEEKIQTTLKLPIHPVAQELAEEFLSAVTPEYIEALLFYGSLKSLSSEVSRIGYVDFFVILKDGVEEAFYSELTDSKFKQKSGLERRIFKNYIWAINWMLPPNTFDFNIRDESGKFVHGAKYCVLSRKILENELSVHSRDHYHRARFSQPMRLVYPRVPEGFQLASQWLAMACRHTFEFMRTELPFAFNPEQYLRNYLRQSYGAEIRPESDFKVNAILEREKHILLPLYREILRERAHTGELVCLNSGEELYAINKTRWEFWSQISNKKFRTRTKLRATMRWAKNLTTFDDWIDYVVDKVQNTLGYRIQLTEFQKKFWWIFGWTHLAHFFLEKRRRTRLSAIEQAKRNRIQQ